ncbi:MAG: J domain-containing protein [Verrucomicrobia bacterium]|nr:J domain-containing protein [Verrucomicrobiota bacterium]
MLLPETVWKTPVEYKNYYKILGVEREATAAEIKKAFRKMARLHHPDVAKDKAGSEDRFKEINEAYEVLGDPEKRKRYDEMGPNWNQPGGPAPGPGGWTGGTAPEGYEFEGTGFSDFFERYFSGAGPRTGGGFGGTPRGAPQSRRGADIEGDLMVTLQESMTGSMRSISLRSIDPATGRPSVQEVQVRIPAGITEGQRLRVPGHGGKGTGGAKPGDLFLRVRLAADPDFRVKGHDLYRDLEISPWEAVLGTTIPVRLPDGQSVQVKIPGGTESADQLRLRKYGLPGKNAPGDLYVVITIEVPAAISPEERSAWEKLRDVSTFNPRKS